MANNNNIRRFAAERHAFVNMLSIWKDSLNQQRGDIHEIAGLLEDLAHKINVLAEIACIENASRCIRMKCDLIRHTLQDASDILRRRPHATREVAEMLNMVALHTGKLTLSKQSGVDVYAENMHREAQEINVVWQTRRRAASPAVERMERDLHAIWNRLHFSIPRCDCLQCGQH